MHDILASFWENFRHNLFKPLLLFFYMGFLVPLIKVPFEFPLQIYQGLTIFLLVSIGWKGGEELASLSQGELKQALGFMVVGFITNFIIGVVAYNILRRVTRLRRIDAATVAGYYGSDSAGTYATCVGVLQTVGTGLCGLHARDAGRDGNSRLPCGAVPGQPAAATGNGSLGPHARRRGL